MVTLELTWAQFEEVRKQIRAIYQSKLLGMTHGELRDVIVISEWDADKVELKLNID